MREQRFADRADAGRRLGDALRRFELHDPLVIGLPRGGVVVAAEVATTLAAPLDVLVVRKVGHPRQRELGLGSVTEDEVVALDEQRMVQVGLGPADLEPVVATELDECRRRAAAYREGRPPPAVAGRTVVLVDDGVATGVTAFAAVALLRRWDAARVVVAAPVAAAEISARLRTLADDLLVLLEPEDLLAVSQFYVRFGQTSDEEVRTVLTTARRSR